MPAPSDVNAAKALSHPVRAQILELLAAAVRSPKELAGELKEPLGNVSYHVRELLNLNCITLVDTEPRRGAIEHYYRATIRAHVVVEHLPKPASGKSSTR